MKALLPISITLAFVLASCSSVKDAVSLKDNPSCRTVLEGFLHSHSGFNGKVPVLIVNYLPQKKLVLHGEIVSRSDSGIVFDPQREGPLHDPPPKFYRYSDIQCAIDSNASIIYGTLPDKYTIVWSMEVEVKKADSLEGQATRLILDANQPFAYCLDPGHYKITGIKFNSDTHYEDKAAEYPDMRFDVRPNVSNYLGDLFLDYATKPSPDLCVIYADPTYRPGYGIMMANFGLIGGLLESLSHPGKQTHVLTVSLDTTFKSQSTLRSGESLLRFTSLDDSTRSPRN